jgi:hypothetical protein
MGMLRDAKDRLSGENNGDCLRIEVSEMTNEDSA